MTGEEFSSFVKLMGWNMSETSRRLGLGRNTPAKYASEGAPEHMAYACAAILKGLPKWSESSFSKFDPTALGEGWQFTLGDMVTKTKGSCWTGKVVGFYSTSLTPHGYIIESSTEAGSVRSCPDRAIRAHNAEE